MASQEHLDKMQLRQNYRNLWHTDLMHTIQADFPLVHVSHTCSAKERCIMTCQGIHVVLVICLVVADVVKVSALNFALLQRYFAALEIQWPPLAFCCKMNLTSRRLGVIIASLVSCSASNK
ncbi:hypothetical protein Tsubulata_008429 [Turnera subulata]|uniref:Uncharacterized protein n=1 Tax=Turnera subulata TaxID=218843 RepID=A0A9Q0FVD6_9ROSI|nr:hypothetical protein Tsubulata_008429 [Turnera subulata]